MAYLRSLLYSHSQKLSDVKSLWGLICATYEGSLDVDIVHALTVARQGCVNARGLWCVQYVVPSAHVQPPPQSYKYICHMYNF